MAAPEIVVPGRPAVSCYPCRGADGPGRGHQDLPGADRVLRLPVLRGTAPRRSRRTPRHVLHPAAKRLGTADPDRIPASVRAGLDRKRHATRASRSAPPAEVAARAGHSVRVLLTVYAHCIPGRDQIASQHIEEALNPSHWPPAGPQEPAQTPESRPSCVRAPAGPSGTQLDPGSPPRSG
jgi:hypothetical protein